jgi:MFS family permease
VHNFLIIWVGQLASLTGSGLTAFALGVWVYQSTGSVTKFALISLSAALPVVVVSPLAGALVDRWDRRWAMLLGNCGAGLSILAIALLLLSGRLELRHIYLFTAVGSTFTALQWTAYSASVTLLVPKKQLGRANGMVQVGQAVARIGAPVLGGILLLAVDIKGILLIDFTTFIFAAATLLMVRIPRAEPSVEAAPGRRYWKDVAYGLTYIRHRHGLLSLMILFGVCNFLMGFVIVLVVPLVLAFTSARMLGTILSIGGLGMLLGSLLVSVWGGPTRRVRGVLSFMLMAGLSIVLGGLRPQSLLIGAAAFVFFFSIALINSCTQTIIQTKVATDLQGRVFSVLTMVAWSALPLAYPIAGPLADRIFEPLLRVNGPLADSVGRLVGVGPGRGIGLLFIVLGSMMVLSSWAAYLYPRLRRLEHELPDVVVSEGAPLPYEPVATAG